MVTRMHSFAVSVLLEASIHVNQVVPTVDKLADLCNAAPLFTICFGPVSTRYLFYWTSQ